MIQDNWYKINGVWYHCITLDNGERYIDGVLQENILGIYKSKKEK